jgi:ATP-dependent DNA ligase
LEGIVAKQKFGNYVTEREHSTWFKILNREYSQKNGREQFLNVSGIRSLFPDGTLAC